MPLAPRFGVEVEHGQLDDPVGLREMLIKYGLVLVRSVSLDDRQLVSLGQRLGDGRLELSARSRTHSRYDPAVSNLTNLRTEDGAAIGYANNATDYWHCDQEFRVHPATLSLLYCLIPPESGGETTFASTLLDNLGLDKRSTEVLRRARSCRRPAPAADHDLTPQVVVSHPALLDHPGSGRASVYISEHAFDLKADDATDRSELLARTLAQIIADENLYRHEWRQGDLLVFDNTQFIHRREAFGGMRWLKSVKVFAPRDRFAVPVGRVVAPDAR
jgi:taurine dioxygenase